MGINCLFLAAALIAIAQAASASTITQILGDTASPFTNGESVNQASWTMADSGFAAPFDGVSCGSDITSNCAATWTFNNYLSQIPTGDTITGATISVGIGDLDSHAPGNQVENFTVAGDNVTAALNTEAEAADLHNLIYESFTVTLDPSVVSQLATGTAAVTFDSQGPGLGVLGDTPFNGVFLDYSTLTLTIKAPQSAAPEPATWTSLLCGMAGLAMMAYGRKRR